MKPVPAEEDDTPDPLPQFTLHVFDDGDGDIEISANTAVLNPSTDQIAPLSMLYGLAILMLDQEGVFQELIERMLQQGPISESDCWNSIALILQEDANDLPC